MFFQFQKIAAAVDPVSDAVCANSPGVWRAVLDALQLFGVITRIADTNRIFNFDLASPSIDEPESQAPDSCNGSYLAQEIAQSKAIRTKRHLVDITQLEPQRFILIDSRL